MTRRWFIKSATLAACALALPFAAPALHDDSPMLQALLDRGGTVYIPAGEYYVHTPLRIKSHSSVYFSGSTLHGGPEYFLDMRGCYHANVTNYTAIGGKYGVFHS